jgi:hypothetical protein
MMELVGPRLRNCSEYLEFPNLGADIRLSACINHIRHSNGSYMEIRLYHHELPGFNSNYPEIEREFHRPGRQVSYHTVIEGVRKRTTQLFRRVMTPIDQDSFWDWSPVIFQPFWFELGGPGRLWSFTFGHVICKDRFASYCRMGVGGIEKVNHSMWNYTQRFEGEISCHYRCNDELNEDQIAFFGPVVGPEIELIFEVRCPQVQRFVTRSNGTKRVTFEPDNPY